MPDVVNMVDVTLYTPGFCWFSELFLFNVAHKVALVNRCEAAWGLACKVRLCGKLEYPHLFSNFR